MLASRTSICTDDFEAFCEWEIANGVDSERKQLSRGPGLFQADLAAVGEVVIWRWRESQRILSEYVLPPDTVEICIARYPESPVWCGMQIPRSTAAIHLGGKPYVCVVPSGGVAYGLVFDRTSPALQTLIPAEILAGAESPTHATAPVPDHLLQRTLAVVDRMLDDDADSVLPSMALDLTLSQCQAVIDACFPCRTSAAPLPRKGLVDDARDVIAHRLSSSLTVQDLLGELGVSRRALELAFRHHLGVSPYQYLLAERLHAARRMLKRDRRSVLDICIRCGFNHPSRFAEHYARQFGELPSQTKYCAR